MKRRAFITLLGGAAVAWPLAARAQQTGRRPKLGVVYLGPVAMAGPRVEALLNGLRAAGYGGPEQIEIVLRTTDGDPTRITPLVAEVVERNVITELIATITSMAGSHRTAIRESWGMASLNSSSHFLVKSGKSKNSPVMLPPGCVTLATRPLSTGSVSRSRATIGIVRVACRNTAATPRNAVEQAASSLSIERDVIEVRTRADFEEAFATAARRGAGAVLMLSSPQFAAAR
jgi:putative tryptophan/tyrosine transport system substrate-binding protein